MLAVLPEPRIDALRAALGGKADEITFLTAPLAHPAQLIPIWAAFVGANLAVGQACRGLGEPVRPGTRAAEIAEGQLHDALASVAFPTDGDPPPARVWLRCPYDLTLGAAAIAEAKRSHECLVIGDLRTPSGHYGGAEHAAAAFAAPLPEPSGPAHTMAFGDRDLSRLRDTVFRSARAAGIEAGRADDLMVCVHEAASNSIRHGGGRGILRIWLEASALVCEIRDPGHITDLLAGRRRPEPLATSGRGLWTIHQVCDLAQVRSSSQGTVVRLHCWL
jgi:anti-sigma regulatory factor (Ser/Thr protein kinase)